MRRGAVCLSGKMFEAILQVTMFCFEKYTISNFSAKEYNGGRGGGSSPLFYYFRDWVPKCILFRQLVFTEEKVVVRVYALARFVNM